MNRRKFDEMKYQDVMAKDYDRYISSLMKNYEYVRALEPVLKYLRKQDICLDVGCGTGSLTIEVSKRCRYIYGLDISKDSIKIAKSKKSDNCKFLVGDAEHLPFADNFFDCVYCTFLLHHVKGESHTALYNIIREMGRVLKDNGILVISKEPNGMNIGNAFLFWVVRHMTSRKPSALGTGSLFIQNLPTSPHERPIFSWELERSLKDAGLKKIVISKFGFVPASLNIHSDSLLKIERILERIPLISFFGTSICAIARKEINK